MGFWRADGCFEHTLATIPRYKGSLKGTDYDDMTSEEKSSIIGANLTALAENVNAMAMSSHGLGMGETAVTNDRLDAFIGLLNLHDLVTDCGDWFGTAASGHSLVARLAMLEGKLFSEEWQRAEEKVRRTNMLLTPGSNEVGHEV